MNTCFALGMIQIISIHILFSNGLRTNIESNIVAQYIDKCHTQPQIVDSDFDWKQTKNSVSLSIFTCSEEKKKQWLTLFYATVEAKFRNYRLGMGKKKKTARAGDRNEREKRLSFYTLIKSAHFISGFNFSIIPLDNCNKSKIACGLPENVFVSFLSPYLSICVRYWMQNLVIDTR